MDVRIIGAPVDLGQRRRGVDMGPSAIRAAGLGASLERLGHKVSDGGNIFSPEPETRPHRNEKARYEKEIIATCETLAKKIQRTLEQAKFPVVLGGDHSIAMGTIAGVVKAKGPTGLIWIDAHADFNTPDSSPTGNIHGMPLAAIVGRGAPLADIAGLNPKVREEKVVLLAIRDVDPDEAEALNASKITVFTMRDIDELGMRKVVDEAIQVAGNAMERVHISFDIDAMDPRWAPGSGTLVEGGLSYREAHLAMEKLHDCGLVGSLELVEVNPLLDTENQTGVLAAGLIASCLGKSIL